MSVPHVNAAFHKPEFHSFEEYRDWYHSKLFPDPDYESTAPCRGACRYKDDLFRLQGLWQESRECRQTITAVRRHPRALGRVRELVCMGMGGLTQALTRSYVEYEQRMVQCAIAMDLALENKQQNEREGIHLPFQVYFQASNYSEDDRELLRELGITVTTTEEHGNWLNEHIGRETMFYEHWSGYRNIPQKVLQGQLPIVITALAGNPDHFRGTKIIWPVVRHYGQIFRVRQGARFDVVARATDGSRGFVRRNLNPRITFDWNTNALIVRIWRTWIRESRRQNQLGA